MCLVVNPFAYKIADKDIICYKHVKRTKIKGVYKSSIQRFEYIIRQLYTNNLDVKYVNKIIKSNIIVGFSYMHCIEGGMFHSYADWLPTVLAISSNYVALKCIIPKGAYYFEGYSKSILCYASSQIKILEEVKI